LAYLLGRDQEGHEREKEKRKGGIFFRRNKGSFGNRMLERNERPNERLWRLQADMDSVG
jgi:hypothetical protein